MLFGSRLNRLATSIRQGISKYAVGSDNPGLVFDFIDNFYQKDKNQTVNFDGAITHARAGNATMTDGYGPELVTNGTFDSDSDWTLGTGWSIAGGKAVKIAGTGDGASQSIDLKEGVAYLVSYDVTRNAGGVQAQFIGGSTVALASKTASGSYTDVLVAVSGNTSLRMFASSTFGGTIDNVSVREMPVIKWAPHNLLTYSEDFSQWTAVNTVVESNISGVLAPDGSVTVDLLRDNTSGTTFRYCYNLSSGTNGTWTGSVFIKLKDANRYLQLRPSGLGTGVAYATFDPSDGSVYQSGGSALVSTSSVSIGDGWYHVSITCSTALASSGDGLNLALTDGTSGELPSYTGDGSSGIYIWGAHLYRSDLGGMVDNPDRGDSYVPTTSSAKYLPRVGHHVYNGSAWVNEGVLAESEDRTNDALYSTILNAQYNTTNATISDNSAVAPTGVEEASTITENTATGNHRFDEKVLSSTVGTRYTFSIYAKKKERSVIGFGGLGLYNAGENVEFDLDNGIAYNGGTGNALVNIQDVGNGWFRCMMTYTVSGTAPFRVHLHNTLINGAPPSSTGVSYTGDGSSGVYVWGLQIEEGDTASSFIPNSGTSAGVTRAAETFTIPSANLPWPTPQYIGSELVTNGDFATTSDWSLQSGVSIGSGVLSTDGTKTGELARQSNIGITSGNLYAISLDVISLTAGKFGVKLGGTTPIYFDTTGSNEAYIIATATDNVQIMGLSGTIGSVDNVSVREINPLSVSIGMEGRMTYADEGENFQIKFLQWLEDGSNFIESSVTTASTTTGRMDFRQEVGGTNDFVSSGNTYFSPDILVPYNIASRHGSTFINGATDGVALTANTTPTALPDLSSTDLDLAYDYMGTISEFRVWDKDIGDAGIVEATNPSLEPSLSLTFEGVGTNSFVTNDWSQ